ncbi:MAG: hypothetical protein C0490_24250, partial [Marivirga sp.]|nr:hypothetical protein [Marivirga sp.]
MKSTINSIITGFVVGVFVTLTAAAQHKLSLQDAVTLAAKNNPEIAASVLETEKAKQQKIIARSLFLPSIHAAAQANHYFQLNPFFGF